MKNEADELLITSHLKSDIMPKADGCMKLQGLGAVFGDLASDGVDVVYFHGNNAFLWEPPNCDLPGLENGAAFEREPRSGVPI